MTLRAYQSIAINAVRQKFADGLKSICLVAPTGSGKTRMGFELVRDVVRRRGKALWLVHRRELMNQAEERVVCELGKTVTVATVQSLLATGSRPVADLLVLDEAHHYVAEQWSTIIDCYNGARTIGLTATPERQDGAPLGDVFQDIVVAANYSQLTRDGYLVPAIVFQPPSSLSRGDTAQDPIDAWLRYSGGARTFVFCQRVNGAVELAKRFREVGVSAEAVEANTPAMERDSIISRFRSGETRILTNVNILTEGIDIPEAACVVIGRQFGHVGNLLQAAGRVLRPSHGKSHAVIIDLTGATLKHGLPTDDREYSLSGRAIATIAYDRIDQGERFRLPGIVTGDELRMVAGQGFALNSDCIPEEIYLAAKRRDWDFMRLILRGIEGAGGCA